MSQFVFCVHSPLANRSAHPKCLALFPVDIGNEFVVIFIVKPGIVEPQYECGKTLQKYVCTSVVNLFDEYV